MIGEIIDGKYKITRLIGEGGMGAVFEGENILISRRVAIKVLHSAMALNQQTVERFQREARAAGRIGNDHILEVLDLGKLPNGDYFMVLEYLDGETLSKRIERLGRLTPAQLVPVIKQVLAGLAAAHGAGIVHRDLKPENIFILKEKAGHKDFVKIIDFGISKFSPLAGSDDGMRMTQTGAIMGTPYYMSPEQARGSLDADARADLYSVGVMMYEAITGQVPFDGRTVNELMFAIALSEPKPIRQFVPDLDPAFEAIVGNAMVKDREKRFQTADDFLQALADWGRPDATNVTGLMGAAGYTGSMPQLIEGSRVPTSQQPIVKEMAQSASGAVPTAPMQAMATAGRQTPGPGGPPKATTNSWATSHADEFPGFAKRPNTGLIAALTLGALGAAGAGAFALYSFLTAPSATDESAAAPPAAPTVPAVPTVAPVAEEPKKESPPIEVKPAEEPVQQKPPASTKSATVSKSSPKTPKSSGRPTTTQTAAAAPPKPTTTAPTPTKKTYTQFGY